MSSRFAHAAVLAIVLSTVITAGCAKRPATTIAAASAPSGTPESIPPGSARGSATPERLASGGQEPATASPTPSNPAGASPATSRPAPSKFTAVADLRDIYFDFDKYDILPQDAEVLDMNARWLKAHPTYLALIEGHCDERGTDEYNVALSERRARAARNYLVGLGVAASRIGIVSYGEERPLCSERAESCWSRNRRAHFLVKPI